MNTKFALAAVLLAAACGGGSPDVDAQLSRTDAPPTIDAAASCDVEATFNAAAPDPATDTAAFATTDNGQPPANIVFWQWGVAGTGANPDFFFFDIPRPVPPGEIGAALDLSQACVNGIDYCMRILTDLDDAGNYLQLLYPDTGTLTLGLTGTGEAGDVLTVTMTGAMFNHYDPDTGMRIMDGCATNVAAFGPVDLTINPDAVAPNLGLRAQRALAKLHDRR